MSPFKNASHPISSFGRSQYKLKQFRSDCREQIYWFKPNLGPEKLWSSRFWQFILWTQKARSSKNVWQRKNDLTLHSGPFLRKKIHVSGGSDDQNKLKNSIFSPKTCDVPSHEIHSTPRREHKTSMVAPVGMIRRYFLSAVEKAVCLRILVIENLALTAVEISHDA
ncbi:hypothetical protein CAEBREN_08247 [Caenorhabditis brenneri]|uniref:Uncharacterized protein n=1 Tax=Caenorhabditis brenneri TaxID=135651 RepID=G0P505_CAEBE|nr:hypothetical protein CAEBREN_08247 [Caenorhabditis brenneri]